MLRTKLFLNLFPLLALLVALSVYALALFSRLTGDLDAIVTQNYLSVTAAQRMELALERLQPFLLRVIDTAPGGDARSAIALRIAEFEQHLQLQLQNIGSASERQRTEVLVRRFLDLRTAIRRMADLGSRSERDQAYQAQILPAVLGIKHLLQDLERSNHEAILETSRSTRKALGQVSRLMLAGLVVALILAGYTCVRTARSILRPIRALTHATGEVARGNLSATVRVESHDELAVLAAAFNTMARELEDYRRHTSDKIVRLHRTMESTLASFQDPIFVLDRTGGIELRNPAATDLAVALELRDRLPEPLQTLVDRTLATGEHYLPDDFGAVVGLRVREVQRFLLPRVLAMRGPDDALVGVAVVLYDITRFRILDDMKTNLIGTVSHELKTPLTGIRMALHLLLEGAAGPLSEPQRDLAATARDDTERLLRILNDLLDLARLEAGGLGLQCEVVKAAEVVDGAVRPLLEQLAGAGVELSREVDPALDVPADLQRSCYALGNLLSNALKHSPRGGRIILRAVRTPHDAVRFSVIDEGPGVPPEHQHRIFERFYRVPGQLRSGAGLGLSIAWEIVLAHGGRIGLNSQPGSPTEFYFELPSADGKVNRLPG